MKEDNLHYLKLVKLTALMQRSIGSQQVKIGLVCSAVSTQCPPFISTKLNKISDSHAADEVLANLGCGL